MEGLLGDEDGDVSRRDVTPRDVSLCRASASLSFRTARVKQEQEATGDSQLGFFFFLNA